MRSFEKLLSEIENLDLEESFILVLDDLFDANGIMDSIERIPVFTGKLARNDRGQKRVIDISSAWGTPISINPYTDKPFYTVAGKGPFEEDERIVFIGECGALGKPNEILKVEDFFMFEPLGLATDAKPKEILNSVVHFASGSFRDHKTEIEKLLKEKKVYEAKKTELEKIEETIAEKKRIKDDLLKFEAEYTEKYPNGLEPLRNECIKLEKDKQELSRSINALTFQKADIEINKKRMQHDLETAEKEFQNLEESTAKIIPKGKTVADVLNALDEYRKNKADIENARKIAEWFSGKYEQRENEKPLSLNEMNSPESFSQRLDYDYSDDLVIPFLTALSTDQIITLFGKPGTGKTTFVQKAAKALGAKCTIISVQNNWTDSSDLLGYFNPLHNSFTGTKFLDALLSAKQEYDRKNADSKLHIICLDEMNLARVEYYFAEFLSMLQLEKKDRWIKVLPNYIEKELDTLSESMQKRMPSEKKYLVHLKPYHSFMLPPNIRFVGTINSDDTTNPLSPKVIDRSFFIELRKESYAREKGSFAPIGYYPLSFFQFDTLLNNLPVFENENGRFKNYVQQMYTFFRNGLGINKDDVFVSYMILAKILPSIRRPDELSTIYRDKKYILAQERIDTIDFSGTYINYLGSN